MLDVKNVLSGCLSMLEKWILYPGADLDESQNLNRFVTGPRLIHSASLMKIGPQLFSNIARCQKLASLDLLV